MKYLIFLLFTCLYSKNGFCQINSTDVLKKFLTSDEFCKYLLPCSKCDTIIVVDTAGYFEKKVFALSGKQVIISAKKYPINLIPVNNEELLKRSCSSLLITGYSTTRKRFCIEYFHLPTNGIGWISYKYKRGVLKKSGFSYGQL